MSNKILYSLAGIIALIYFSVVFILSDNIPYLDDYTVEQNFLLRYIQSSTMSEKTNLLIEQHNEHRLLFTRLVTLVVYFLTGKLNYCAYIIIANIMLAGLGLLMYKTIQNNTTKGLCLLAIVVLLCNGQNLETSL